jgi:hypothetical protein
MNFWHGLGSPVLDSARAGERSGAVQMPTSVWIDRLVKRSARGY